MLWWWTVRCARLPTRSSTRSDPQAHPRQIVERTALALLTYVEENAEGFRVLTRDSPKTDPAKLVQLCAFGRHRPARGRHSR